MLFSIFDTFSSVCYFISSIITVVAFAYLVKFILDILLYKQSQSTGKQQSNIVPSNHAQNHSVKPRRRRRANRAHTDPLKKTTPVGDSDGDETDQPPQIIYQLFCGKNITIKDSGSVMVGDNCTLHAATEGSDDEDDSDDSDDDDGSDEEEGEESGCDTNYDDLENLRKASTSSAPGRLLNPNNTSPTRTIPAFDIAPITEQLECSAGTFRFSTLNSSVHVKTSNSKLIKRSLGNLHTEVPPAPMFHNRSEREIMRELEKWRQAECPLAADGIESEARSTRRFSSVENWHRDDDSLTVESEISRGPAAVGADVNENEASPSRRVSMPELALHHSPSDHEMRLKKAQIMHELKKLRGEDLDVEPGTSRHNRSASWKIFTRIKHPHFPRRKKSK